MTDQAWRYDPGGALCWPTISPPNSDPARRDPPDQPSATWAAVPETRRFRVARHRVDIPLANGVMFPLSASRAPRRSAPSNFKAHETKKRRYTRDVPSSETGDASRLRMGETFDIEVKQARTQVFRRDLPKVRLAATVAAYKAMLKNADLLNPRLAENERLTRARRLVRTYERLRKRDPKFHDDSPQLRAARSLINRFQYQQTLKRKAALTLAAG